MKYDHSISKRFGFSLIGDTIVRKKAYAHNEAKLYSIEAICQHFIHYPDPMVVPVYNFKILEKPIFKHSRRLYQYDMKRLYMLNKEEKLLINDNYRKGCHYHDDKNGYPKLVKFMNKVIEQRKYLDIHDQNILKDEDGNYRLIDLEGFVDIEKWIK